jgi:hypothetical protein
MTTDFVCRAFHCYAGKKTQQQQASETEKDEMRNAAESLQTFLRIAVTAVPSWRRQGLTRCPSFNSSFLLILPLTDTVCLQDKKTHAKMSVLNGLG